LVAVVLMWAAGSPASVASDRRDDSRDARRDDGSNRDGRFGKPLDGLTPEERRLFADGLVGFAEEEEAEEGLGPIFNDVGCAACHFVPAIGGSSEISETRAAMVRGGVYHELPGGSLFQNKATSPECAEKIPKEANVRTKRETQPLFGSGLIEAIPDAQIREYAALQAATHPEQAGRIHRVLDVASGELRVGRFGWKAQQATLPAFSGDAYVNEMGITTPNAPNDDPAKLARCDEVVDPEDDGEDLIFFENFMRLLAPPPRQPSNPRIERGKQVFEQIGCAVCHRAGFTAVSPIRARRGHGRRDHPGGRPAERAQDRAALGHHGQRAVPARRQRPLDRRGHPAPRQPGGGGAQRIRGAFAGGQAEADGLPRLDLRLQDGRKRGGRSGGARRRRRRRAAPSWARRLPRRWRRGMLPES
jgi:hypothetical protein